MKPTSAFVAAVLTAAASCFLTTEAAAQATRTWVSGVGDDVNPCSRTAPCKTFAGAISKTASGGIIDVLDPGGFGTVTITKPITIRQFSGIGSILSTGGINGIVVNAPGAAVSLIGINVDGVGTGASGVNVIAANQVYIVNCKIAGFSTAGVRVASAASVRVSIKDTVINNSAVGLLVAPSSNIGQAVFLDNVHLDGNTNNISATAPAIIALRRSSVIGGALSIGAGVTLRSYGDNALSGGNPTVVEPLK